MIRAIEGPLISQPESWVLVFDRKATSRFMSFIAFGRYKHVRAYGYVPFLHVWVFFDPHIGGVDIVLAADGPPARIVMAAWLEGGDPVLIRMPRRQGNHPQFPVFGWCVPTIKRLIGLRSSALRPDSLWRHCLQNGGTPLRESHGNEQQPQHRHDGWLGRRFRGRDR